jgi:sugar lactone lactonase YvrE
MPRGKATVAWAPLVFYLSPMRRASFLAWTVPTAVAVVGFVPACSSLLGFEDLTAAPEDAGAAGQDAEAGLLEAQPDTAEGATPDSPDDISFDTPAADASDASDAVQDVQQSDVDCGDTTSNPDHCGRCGHSCLGGDCVQGMCQAFKLATIHDGAFGMAQDESRLYIAGLLNNEIVRVDKVTGAVLSIDTAGAILVPAWISVQGSSMVWSNRVYNTGSIASCPVTGCGGSDPTVLIANADRPNGVIVDGDLMYWAETQGGTVRSAKVSNGSAVQDLVASSSGYQPFRLAMRGDHLYFSEVGQGRVVRVSKTGGDAVVLGSSASPAGVVVTDDRVYWADSTATAGRIISVPNTDPPDGGLTTTNVAVGQDMAFSVAADGENLYWIASGTSAAATGALRMCPLAGCPGTGPVTLASDLAYPIDLVVDSDAIYVTIFGLDSAVDGAVLKIARP